MEMGAGKTVPIETDVLVIGGGPGGSTTGIVLAEMGHRVTVVEKARHPRFHIGESLLPANLPLFRRLGVLDQIEAIGMQKWGAEFISKWHGRSQTFEFSEAWSKSMPYAYQVRRSELDEILFKRAAHQGADVVEGCRVRDVEFLPQNKDEHGGALVTTEHENNRTQT
jgi:2-polyprenyl-6-methoxyphenol hydroxylase-like FAD-dependent oxidoreductase